MKATILITGSNPRGVSKIQCNLTGCPVYESKNTGRGCWVDYNTKTEARQALKDCVNKLREEEGPELLSYEKKYNCISYDSTTATIYTNLEIVDKFKMLH